MDVRSGAVTQCIPKRCRPHAGCHAPWSGPARPLPAPAQRCAPASTSCHVRGRQDDTRHLSYAHALSAGWCRRPLHAGSPTGTSCSLAVVPKPLPLLAACAWTPTARCLPLKGSSTADLKVGRRSMEVCRPCACPTQVGIRVASNRKVCFKELCPVCSILCDALLIKQSCFWPCPSEIEERWRPR